MGHDNGPHRLGNGVKSSTSAFYAPWHKIPGKTFVSIEHPCIVQNVDKGLDLLGGPTRLQALIRESNDVTGHLYLRPGDRTSKSIPSINVTTKNIVLKVTVPKKTGLKRKRGSQGPFIEADENGKHPTKVQQKDHVSLGEDTQSLVGGMRDNPAKYQVQPLGTIDSTHRFRGMPDFVFSTTNKPFMQKVHEHILPFDYEKMKAFTFDESKGVKPNTEIVPPPRYSHLPLPFNYSYRQNPSVKQVVDELGNTTTINIHAAPKIWNQPVPFDVAQVPNGPADIPPVETLPLALQRLIGSATRLMEDRPIFTRRALMNSIPGNDWERLGQNMAKHIYQYVGYMFASGPWRDGIVKFGVDPRKDPECRKYQTMMFMLEKEPKDNRAKWVRIKNNPAVVTEAVKKKKESHLFDGQTVSKDGKVWQVCDITDPFMKDLLATTNLRTECDIQSDGWYHNGTWAKAKIFMKHKISDILEGRPPKDASYTKVAREMPDVITRRDKSKATLPKEATSLEVSLATSIRAASLSNPLFDAQEAAKQVQDYEEEENEDREDLGRDDEEHEKDEGEGESEVDDDREDLRRDEEEHEEDEGEEESEVDEDDIDVPIDPMIQMIDPRLTEAGAELGRLNDGSEIAESIGDGMEIDDAQL